MMPRLVGYWAIMSLLLSTGVGHAQELGSEKLRQAENAFTDIFFEKAAKLANEAISSGELKTPEESSWARFIIGVGLAAAKNETGAKEMFRSALSINPDMPLDTSLGPQLQAPFLEARADLAVRKQHLSADIEIVSEPTSPALAVEVTDPTSLVRAVSVSLRPEYYESEAESAEFRSGEADVSRYRAIIALREFGFSAQGELEDSIDGFAAAVKLLDQYGNVVWLMGKKEAPIALGNPFFEEPTAFEELVSSPLFWIGTGVVVAGAGALVYAFAIAPPERLGGVSSNYD